MYKVKLSIAIDNARFARQTPKGTAIWGDYQFFINKEVDSPDFWVVYSKGERKTETCFVAPENTLFITGEPETVYHYSKGFIKQFAKIVACQSTLDHPNQIRYQPAQPWHIGKIDRGNGDVSYSKKYDDFKTDIVPQKTKLISVVSSNRGITKGHQDRIDFVLKLKSHFGAKIDLFGRGFNGFDDKWDVIAPYKYHVVIENSSYPDYWTEKLADCYLGGAYPIYHGCTNLEEYFDNKAYSNIDIKDFDTSVKIIENILQADLFEKNAKALIHAKNLVLDKYNLFNLISEQLDTMNPDAPKENLTLKHDMAFVDLAKIRLMMLPRIMNKIKMKLK